MITSRAIVVMFEAKWRVTKVVPPRQKELKCLKFKTKRCHGDSQVAHYSDSELKIKLRCESRHDFGVTKRETIACVICVS